MKKILSIAITMILLSSIFLIAAPIKGTTTIADVEPVDWQSGLAGNVPMPKLDPADAGEAAHAAAIMSTTAVPPTVGTTVWDWYLRTVSRQMYPPTYPDGYPYMTLKAISGNVEVWVAQDEMLKFRPGDPRNANPMDWNVTDAMAQFIADEFNNVIYPTATTYFGMSADRDGTDNYFQYVWPTMPYRWNWIPTDNPQRVIIKIFNIWDDSFEDPTYPSYVVGFFNSAYDSPDYYDRNMIQMDNWNYSQRLGPMGYSWYPGRTVTRPYVYESTVVHEYQHLIHADWNPEDPSFMNEGCSMYSELLAGYGIDPRYLNYYFYTPDNSLTEWGDLGDYDILADYGESALWAVYLSDHYGGAPFIRSFVQNGIPGIDGINYALAEYGYKQRFDDVFHDWRLANLIRASSGPYSYQSLDLNAPGIIPVRMYEVNGFPVPWTTGTSFGDTIALNGYSTEVSVLGPYATDYIAFRNWDRPGFIGFDGDDVAQYGWTMTPDGWYSGLGNMMNAPLIGNAYVDPADPTLTLVTAYGLESFWDFGFVQVSTDNGLTWTSLENVYTTYDYETNVQAIIDNLPGLTDYNPDFPDWTTMTFDLTTYAGQNVLINFRYMTDQYVNYEGWWINSASVSGTALTLTATYPPASYQVTAVKALSCGRSGKFNYIPYDLSLNSNTWTGEHNTYAKDPTFIILIVSPIMLHGTVDYQFRVYKK